MSKFKRITAIMIAVIMVMSIVPTVYGTNTPRSYSYTFEDSLESNGMTFNLEAQKATNTDATYTLTQEGSIGGKAENDKAMVFRASGTYANGYKAPLLGIDFRNNPITANTRIDFDWYIDETTGDDYQNHVFSFIPLTHYMEGTTNKADTGVYTSIEPARANGYLRHFLNQRDSSAIYSTEQFNKKWHKVSIITEIVAAATEGGNRTLKMSLYIDGILVNNAVSRTLNYDVDGLAGLRFKPETNSVSTGTKKISAVMAVDNVQIYEIGTASDSEAIVPPSNNLYTIDNANVMTFASGVTVAELATIFSGYSVSVKRGNITVTDAIISGDQITLTNNSDVVSECYYASVPVEYNRYSYTFDDGAVTVSGGNMISDANGFTWGTAQMSSGVKEVGLVGGLGTHSAEDNALTIKTTSFTTINPNDGPNSPSFTWSTQNVPIDNILVLDTDVFFNGNQTRAQIRLDLEGTSGSETAATQLAIDFNETHLAFGGNKTTAASCGDGIWHNLVVEIYTNEKKAYAYIDGVLFADGVEISLDSITKLKQIKFDSRYYLSGGVADGNFAIDNLTLYSGKAADYLYVASDISDVRVNNAVKSILVAKNITNKAMKDALNIPANFNMHSSGNDDASPKVGDTVTVSHKTDSSITKTYTVSLMEPDYCVNENFESSNEIVKEATKDGKSWYYTETSGGFNSWGFEVIETGADKVNSTSNNDNYAVALLKGLGGKAATDTALAVETKGSGKGDKYYNARTRLTFGNPTGFAYYEGKIYADFDVYLSGNTPYHNIILELNYNNLTDDANQKQIFLVANEGGELKYDSNVLFDSFGYDKWHNLRIEIDSPNKVMYVSLDGTRSDKQIDISNTGKSVTGLHRLYLEQRFDGVTTDKPVPNGIMAIDNVCVYRRANLPELRLTGADGIVVDNGAGMIYCESGKSVDSVTVPSGVTKTVDGDIVTVSNGLYSKEYSVLNLDNKMALYQPAYNTIAGDSDNVNLTVNAYMPDADENSPKIILAKFTDSILSNAEIVDNTKYQVVGDIITYTKRVAIDDSYSVFALENLENLVPISPAKKEIKYSKPVQLFLLGDSLTTAYNSGRFPQKGWGEVLKTKFDTDKVVVYNEAIGGESTESLLAKDYGIDFEGRVLNKLNEGDFVFVSFMHNDRYGGYKDLNNDGTEESKYGCTLEEYKANLRTIADKLKEKGAKVVFVINPNTGREFDQHTITPPGYTSTSGAWDSSGNWPQGMRDVAAEKGVALIDVYAIHNAYIDSVAKSEAGIVSNEQYLQTGDNVPESIRREMFLYQLVESGVLSAAARANHYNQGIKDSDSDLTHLSQKGAEMVVDWMVDEIKKSTSTTLSELNGYIK